MKDFRDIVHLAYTNLVDLLYRTETTRTIDLIMAVEDNPNKTNLLRIFSFGTILPLTIINEKTLEFIQIKELFKAIDNTITESGSGTLFRSLIQPPTSLDLILAKQDSLRELETNDKLRNSIENYLYEFRMLEKVLFDYIVGIYTTAGFNHWAFGKVMETSETIVKSVKAIPNPESKYLQLLLNDIKEFGETELYRLLRGPIYRTTDGLKPKEDIGFFTLRKKFNPHPYSPIVSLINIGTPLFLTGLYALGHIKDEKLFYSSLALLGLGFINIWYMTRSKNYQDLITVGEPIRKMLIKDRSFKTAIDSIGKLDEIISFTKYAKTMPVDMAIPEISNSEYHYFFAKDMRNPILAKGNAGFVPNDINLDGQKLTIITGSNSGGKTTSGKSIAQNQILGQIGSYVVARYASMSIANRIAYHAPIIDNLENAEGAFGENLKIVLDIFYATTPKSLVVLDTLGGGTTIEEETNVSHEILNYFYTKGNNTILITHNHELAHRFQQENKGQFLQAEFKGETPTYKLIDGIAQVSHADRIAKKVGFSKDGIMDHLKKNGYIK